MYLAYNRSFLHLSLSLLVVMVVICDVGLHPFAIGTIGPQPTLCLACLQTNLEAVDSPNQLGTDVLSPPKGGQVPLSTGLSGPGDSEPRANGMLGHKAF